MFLVVSIGLENSLFIPEHCAHGLKNRRDLYRVGLAGCANIIFFQILVGYAFSMSQWNTFSHLCKDCFTLADHTELMSQNF